MHPLMFASAALLAAAGADSAGIPEIRFEKYTLPNGLEVVLHEDHTVPIVATNVWYHVGSKNERPGRTGFAHLFEHMMFQGAQHHDADYFGPLQKVGGRVNGSTSHDRTNYWENVPSAFLELALWMEADRMGFLLPAMTQQRLDNQRDVVKNERRQSYENRPYGLAEETILAAMYPAEHPYNWPVIGSMADVTAASRDDVQNFFRRYYHPGNASLCIAGDFDPAQAKCWVAKYFGPLPSGPKVAKMQPQPAMLTRNERIRMEDRVGLPRLYLNWHSVPDFAADEAELEILGDVLSGGKTSRLYRRLVREKQIAQEVWSYQDSGEISGRFYVIATARPGHRLDELEAAIDEEIQRLRQEPPTADEIARATSGREARLLRALESVGGFGGRADRLNMYNVLTGDPGFLRKDYERYLKVDAAAVQKPLEPLPPPTAVADDFDRAAMPKPAAEGEFHAPAVQRRRLSNGMQMLVVENHNLPLVQLRAVFPVGRSADPAARLGLADMMAAVWDEGTQQRSAMEIAEQLAAVGADLSIGASWDTTSAALSALKRHFQPALAVYGDVLQHPAFAADELNRQRAMRLGRLVQIREESGILASLAANATLYGQDHPYGRPQFGAPAALNAIAPADLADFYRTRIRPEQATLIAVGDVTADEIVGELEKTLGAWRPATAAASEQPLPPLPAPGPTRLILVDKPHAAQSVISAGILGVERKSPDYFPLAVMNSILGGQFMSRLNMNLREDKGYTYGARTYLDWRVRQPGSLTGGASVQTAVTAPAVVEVVKEYEGMTGRRPITADEVESCKKYLTRGMAAEFETTGQMAQQLESLVQFQLPDDYYQTLVPGIQRVTVQHVERAAKKYMNLEHLVLIVVGDRAAIETSLRRLPIGQNMSVCQFDEAFRLAPER